MAFDDKTRRALLKTVTACRNFLTEDFDEQLRSRFGIYAKEGRVLGIERLTALTDAERDIARVLRDRITHLSAGKGREGIYEAVGRILREQAFTILNRFAALRMAEERGIIRQSVGAGLQSKGFRVFEDAAGGEQAAAALGGQYERYLVFLDCLFDELSLDLGILFDRSDAMGLLFPTEAGLRKLFEELNSPAITPLWVEDETIGWIYQYYNDPEERATMRDPKRGGSTAPRNSRELAVRNQFFTPRYVVEFLTDNTLGRLWYEMTKGQTRLKDQCRYLVRRPMEFFLPAPPRGAPAWLSSLLSSSDFAHLPENPLETEMFLFLNHFVELFPALEMCRLDHQSAVDRFLNPFYAGRAVDDQAFLSAHPIELFDALVRHSIGQHEYPAPRKEPVLSLPVTGSLWTGFRLRMQSSSSSSDQQEILREPVFIPHHPLKDPREIRLLDPACGSMHFGLYAFDLFIVIYDEAWEIAHGPDDAVKTARAFAPFVTFAASFPDKAAFLREVPRLIIEHNIHGIDIDQRAAQIAGLSLWLRAQRAWHQDGLKPASRPRITRSNLVCAEPMLGEKALLREFVEQQFPAGERPAFAFLLETVFDRMTLAGEAGSLLLIEEEIRAAIAGAKRLWKEKPKAEQTTLFPEAGVRMGQSEMRLDLSGITDEQFWERAEQRIYDALQVYAEQAGDGGGFKRRLFADDAAQGFAFIDLCRKRYDVVVMNPPFGDAVFSTEELLHGAYPNWCKNLASAFVRMATERFAENGAVGVVADRTIIVKSSYEDFRREIYQHLHCLGDFGWGVLDANVEVTTFVLSKRTLSTGCFFDQRQVEDKDARLLSRVQDLIEGRLNAGAFSLLNSSIATLPNCAFAYDMPSAAIRMFEQFENLRQRGHRALQGHNLSMEQFGRLAWEVPVSSIHDRTFIRMYKGGEFSKLYQPSYEVALWLGDGGHLRGHSGTRWGNEQYQEAPAIGYGKRGDFLDAHVMPGGHIFTVEGLTVFPKPLSEAWAILAVLNSSACSYLLHFYSGQHKMSGYVEQLPLPDPHELNGSCSLSCEDTFQRKRTFDCANELSPEFLDWPFLKAADETIQSSADRLIRDQQAIREAVTELDEMVSASFGLDHTRLLKDAFVQTQPADVLSIAFDASDASAARRSLVDTLLHYVLGCAFGRWDVRYATGERLAPELPDPFAPLPVCPPGMLQGDDGLPLSPEAGRWLRTEGRYPLDVAWDGILVDDPEHPLDIVGRIRAAMHVIYAERAEIVETEACDLIGVKAKPRENLDALRGYFRDPNRFFKDHLARYCKSRRKAPIYWPISTASGAYTLWIYYHRLTSQTLYTCVEIIDLKRESIGRDLETLRSRIGPGGTSAERDKVEELTSFHAELKALRDHLLAVAGLPYRPNLNDGVQITAAPLWKCFLHGPWQNALKDTWKELQKGDYDWAHLALAIRPEEVRKKCKTDRSIAIAHGLEELCEVKAPEAKKKRASKKSSNIDDSE